MHAIFNSMEKQFKLYIKPWEVACAVPFSAVNAKAYGALCTHEYGQPEK